MNFYEFQKEAYNTAVEKGFWELEESILRKLDDKFTAEEIDAVRRAFYSQKLMLIASEIFESFEAVRKGRSLSSPRQQDIEWFVRNWDQFTDDQFTRAYEEHFKGDVWEEQGDAMIRIADLAGRHKANMDFLVRAKMRYNKLRGKKHGKAF